MVALVGLSLVASSTLTGSASATSVPGGVLADGDPQRVLQSVSVGIAPDGGITTVDSTSIGKTDSSGLESSDDSFEPAEVVDELPVRILTSYRLGDRAGTDLRDIAGESGRVVVEVVVQNTTVRPQQLTYDVGSAQRTQYALVGAPLTVVATADLGDSGLSRVVTEETGSDTADDVTNGLLSRTEDDAVEVQWAGMLAPPRLSPSVTFRLVQETDDFEVPTFDINVQPGLVTDTSVQRLIEAAFAEDAGSALDLESRTLSLVGRVTSALEVASGGLADIEQLLDTSAGTIGQQTIADLGSSSERITTELQGLSGELDGLNRDIDSELRSTESSTLDQLSRAVTAIKARLGNPDTTPVPAPIRVESCSFDFAGKVIGPGSTVFEQLLQVRTQLNAIGDASRRCAGTLAEELRATIGSTDPGFVCEEGSVALICALDETKSSIDEKALDLSTVGTDVAGRFEEGRLQDLRRAVDEVNDTVVDLTDTAQTLVDGSTSVGPLVASLQQLRGGLSGLQAALQPGAGSGIPATLDGIHGRAQAALAALGTSGGSSPVSEQARAAAIAACALALDPTADPATQDAVSVLLRGTSCDGTPRDVPDEYGAMSVAGRADAATSAIADVVALSDLSDPTNPVNQQLAGLRGSVDGLLSLVVGLVTLGAPGLSSQVQVLVEDLTSLGAGIDELPSGTTCPADLGTDPETGEEAEEDDLTALNRSFRHLYCKQVGLEGLIADQFGAAGGVLSGVQDELTSGQDSADTARANAQGAVDDTTSRLNKRLERAGTALRTQGARQIAAQRQRLDAEVADVTQLLGANITSAITLIDSRVRTANGDLDESQRRLVADLARVLTDIGTGRAGGTGLLGALASGAAETRISNRSILQVSDTAGAFRNLRSAAMEDTLLQQAQFTRSLELQQELPVLGLTLPEGSRHVSVFSFHLGQE